MVVALTINNIVRNQLDKVYELLVDKMGVTPLVDKEEVNPFDLYKAFKKRKEPAIKQFDPNIEDDEDVFEERKGVFELYDVYKKIYTDFCFEIFARSNQVQDGFLRDLSLIDGVDIILVSSESPTSKLATLLFLTNSQFNLKGVNFVNGKISDVKKLKFDYLITDNPKYLKSKALAKKVVKFEKHYNKDIHAVNTVYNHEDIITFIKKVK